MMEVESYQVRISQDDLDELKQRLALSKFPDELDEAGWDMGSPF